MTGQAGRPGERGVHAHADGAQRPGVGGAVVAQQRVVSLLRRERRGGASLGRAPRRHAHGDKLPLPTTLASPTCTTLGGVVARVTLGTGLESSALKGAKTLAEREQWLCDTHRCMCQSPNECCFIGGHRCREPMTLAKAHAPTWKVFHLFTIMYTPQRFCIVRVYARQ